MNTHQRIDTDVLIVGAGPTGLMLANLLGQRGINAMLIDRHSGPAQQTRAMAVHARTLEIYAQLGIAEQAVALGRKGTGGNFWSDGRHKARIGLEEMGRGLSPFPYVLMLGQDENEILLGEQLQRWHMAVQWNTELRSLQQFDDRVVTTLGMPDGTTRQIAARYVAGCDGGRSAVRELNHIGFPGAAYEHVFFVADTTATGPMVPDELNIYLWKDGFHLFFPMRGADRWRVIGILPKKLNDKPGLSFDELVPHIRGEAGADLNFASCDWFSTYRIQHRCTEKFRERRCLLLGDAAHVHSPMGGQGMNTGLQDAWNLAWKLQLVLNGRADASLLDSFESERMQVAKSLLSSTDRAFTLLVSESRLAGFFRTAVVAKIAAIAMRSRRAQKFAFPTLSQIGISYRRSALSENLPGLAAKSPHAGDRFPWLQLSFGNSGEREDLFKKLDGRSFNLLLVNQDMPAGDALPASDLLKVHRLAADAENAQELARAGISGRAFFLLRPDGHIALAGTRFNSAAVQQWFANAQIDIAASAANEYQSNGSFSHA